MQGLSGEGLDGWLSKLALSPREIGSVAPSSSQLAKAMTQQIAPEASVLELGAGDGAITSKIIDRLVRPDQLTVVEIDKEFANTLRNKFFQSRVVEQDAEEFLRRSDDTYDFVLSGIPFAVMAADKRSRVFRLIEKKLRPGGKFIMFQYSETTLGELKQFFENVRTQFVLLNLPPAFVFTCVKRSQPRALQPRSDLGYSQARRNTMSCPSCLIALSGFDGPADATDSLAMSDKATGDLFAGLGYVIAGPALGGLGGAIVGAIAYKKHRVAGGALGLLLGGMLGGVIGSILAGDRFKDAANAVLAEEAAAEASKESSLGPGVSQDSGLTTGVKDTGLTIGPYLTAEAKTTQKVIALDMSQRPTLSGALSLLQSRSAGAASTTTRNTAGPAQVVWSFLAPKAITQRQELVSSTAVSTKTATTAASTACPPTYTKDTRTGACLPPKALIAPAASTGSTVLLTALRNMNLTTVPVSAASLSVQPVDRRTDLR